MFDFREIDDVYMVRKLIYSLLPYFFMEKKEERKNGEFKINRLH